MWTSPATDAPRMHFVAPDLAWDVVVACHADGSAIAQVYRPSLSPSRHRVQAGVMYAGLRLHAGQRVGTLERTIAAGSGRVSAPAILAVVTEQLERGASRSAPAWLTVAVAHAAREPRLTVAKLARASGLSVRSLRRAFEAWVGVGPKGMMRLLRARAASDRLAIGGDAATVAGELGFSDQAHMTRELRRFFDATPGAIQARPELADLFNPGRDAAGTLGA